VTYTTPIPSTVSAGDTFPASAYNIISADLQDHESRIKTGVESYTTAQKTALAGVATGTVVYDSTLGVFQSYTGSAWVNLQGTPPALTTAQKTALTGVATGTMVYDSTLNRFETYNGTAWTLTTTPPSVTTTQKTALSSAPYAVTTGTMVYDSTLGRTQIWNGSAWVEILTQTVSPSAEVHLTSSTSFTSNGYVSWQDATYLNDLTWSSVTNPDRLNVNTSGLYSVCLSGSVTCTATLTLIRASIQQFGLALIDSYQPPTNTTSGFFSVSGILYAAAGSYFRASITLTGGSAYFLGGDTTGLQRAIQTRMAVSYLGKST